ncbi:ZIP family metal transporter [Rodentibacter myodis]|uniref:ZIP family metal transporter n=1 Tax=Rodentibacter myodis TaxID=1907939 RepID=A0A1V3JRY1_9PAST|nr:ZIP family metal transporter [Rodentibacter myodis]OOF59563.1 ZIP family metal transporter [Rodentibacter myodis]
MFDYFLSLNPILQAFIAGLFTWFCTIFGSAFVFFFKQANQKLLDSMMGFAAGVMIAASFWSLLEPSFKFAKQSSTEWYWLPTLIGFLAGGLFLRIIDYIVPHLHLSKPIEEAEGIQPQHALSKSMLLFLAITIHNIPEGLAIGVAFGAIATLGEGADTLPLTLSAIGLAIGMGLQNIPEGSALSMPIRAEGHSRMKAFTYGAFSAVVEPIGAVIGALFVISMTSILPYALAFAAGAMIFVVVEELIPESQSNGNTDIATLSLMLGFSLMMVLDVAFG